MTTYTFANEKMMQKMFNLKHRPERYSSIENANYACNRREKIYHVIAVAENPMGIAQGYYVACPADATRIINATNGAINYAE